MIRTPSRSTRARTSADWASASALDPLVHRRQVDPDGRAVGGQAQLGGAVQSTRMPGRGDERLGRHAVVEHAGAAHAVALDDGDLAAVLGGDQRRLVAGRAPTHDHDPGHRRPPPRMSVARSRYVGGPALRCPGAALRRLRVEHGSRPDEGAGPVLADGRHGVADGLAAHLRRRGLRVGGRALHSGRGARVPGVRRALRRAGPRRRPARPVGGRRAGVAQEAAAAGAHPRRRRAGVDLRPQRLRRR